MLTGSRNLNSIFFGYIIASCLPLLTTNLRTTQYMVLCRRIRRHEVGMKRGGGRERGVEERTQGRGGYDVCTLVSLHLLGCNWVCQFCVSLYSIEGGINISWR